MKAVMNVGVISVVALLFACHYRSPDVEPRFEVELSDEQFEALLEIATVGESLTGQSVAREQGEGFTRKISTRSFRLAFLPDQELPDVGGSLAVTHTCTGTCSSDISEGCSVSGCDVTDTGCSSISCGSRICKASCAKTSGTSAGVAQVVDQHIAATDDPVH